MRKIILSSLLLAALLSACSTPESRIDANRSAFNQYPSDVQEKIKAGRVDIGFTPEMVRMAMGDPVRQFTRKTESGESEVWIYADSKPQVSLGFGFASFGHHSATGVGVATSTGGYEPDEKTRVVFRNGRVDSVEHRKG